MSGPGRRERSAGRSQSGQPAPPQVFALELPAGPDFQPGGQGHTCAVRCKAGCCRYFSLPIETPRSADDFDDIRWYLMHEMTHVYKYRGDWYLLVLSRCRNLLPNNLCAIYETRPRTCADYDPSDCEFTGAVPYELYFENERELEEWLVRRTQERHAKRLKAAKTKAKQRPARKRQARATGARGTRRA